MRDTLTVHFDTVIDEVKVAVEALDWKVQGKANELWWMAQNLPGSVWEKVADIEGRLQRQTRPEGGSHEKKVRIRIPDHTNPEVFAGDRGKDKEGFVAWRDRLAMHLDTVWPGSTRSSRISATAKRASPPRSSLSWCRSTATSHTTQKKWTVR